MTSKSKEFPIPDVDTSVSETRGPNSPSDDDLANAAEQIRKSKKNQFKAMKMMENVSGLVVPETPGDMSEGQLKVVEEVTNRIDESTGIKKDNPSK